MIQPGFFSENLLMAFLFNGHNKTLAPPSGLSHHFPMENLMMLNLSTALRRLLCMLHLRATNDFSIPVVYRRPLEEKMSVTLQLEQSCFIKDFCEHS